MPYNRGMAKNARPAEAPRARSGPRPALPAESVDAERVLAYPGVRFELDDQSIEAIVFPHDGIRQAPVSPVDGRPMKRANKLEVEALLDS